MRGWLSQFVSARFPDPLQKAWREHAATLPAFAPARRAIAGEGVALEIVEAALLASMLMGGVTRLLQRALPFPLPEHVPPPAILCAVGFSADTGEAIAEEVLRACLDILSIREVSDAYSRQFLQTLTDILDLEKTSKDVRLSNLDPEARLNKCYQQVKVDQAERDFLESKVKEVDDAVKATGVAPSFADIAQEAAARRDEWIEAAGLAVFQEAETDAQEALVDACKRQYKRLAVMVYPRTIEEANDDLPRALRFTTLGDHRHDLVYMKGMEAALRGLPLFGGDGVVDRLGSLVDRLNELNATYENLRTRAGQLRAEVDHRATTTLADTASAERALEILCIQRESFWEDIRRRCGSERAVADQEDWYERRDK